MAEDNIPNTSFMNDNPKSFPTVGKRNRRMRTISGSKNTNLKKSKGTGTKKSPNKNNNNEERPSLTNKEDSVSDLQSIPLFLKKLYKMIDTCDSNKTEDSNLAEWTEDGEMFVVKDAKRFQEIVIPQFFDHSKFSSFARQLNFYGFKKAQSKPLKNSDFDPEKAKYITFYHQHFKRGRMDLLQKIERSTKGGTDAKAIQEYQTEISDLKEKVQLLEEQNSELNRRLSAVEDFISKQFDNSYPHSQTNTYASVANKNSTSKPTSNQNTRNAVSNWNSTNGYYSSNTSQSANGFTINSSQSTYTNSNNNNIKNSNNQIASLPPHPKAKKEFPPNSKLPPPPDDFEFDLRGLSHSVDDVMLQEFSELKSMTRQQGRNSTVDSVFDSSFQRNLFQALMRDTSRRLASDNMEEEYVVQSPSKANTGRNNPSSDTIMENSNADDKSHKTGFSNELSTRQLSMSDIVEPLPSPYLE